MSNSSEELVVFRRVAKCAAGTYYRSGMQSALIDWKGFQKHKDDYFVFQIKRLHSQEHTLSLTNFLSTQVSEPKVVAFAEHAILQLP